MPGSSDAWNRMIAKYKPVGSAQIPEVRKHMDSLRLLGQQAKVDFELEITKMGELIRSVDVGPTTSHLGSCRELVDVHLQLDYYCRDMTRLSECALWWLNNARESLSAYESNLSRGECALIGHSFLIVPSKPLTECIKINDYNLVRCDEVPMYSIVVDSVHSSVCRTLLSHMGQGAVFSLVSLSEPEFPPLSWLRCKTILISGMSQRELIYNSRGDTELPEKRVIRLDIPREPDDVIGAVLSRWPPGDPWMFISGLVRDHTQIVYKARLTLRPRSDTENFCALKDGGRKMLVHSTIMTGHGRHMLLCDRVHRVWSLVNCSRPNHAVLTMTGEDITVDGVTYSIGGLDEEDAEVGMVNGLIPHVTYRDVLVLSHNAVMLKSHICSSNLSFNVHDALTYRFLSWIKDDG